MTQDKPAVEEALRQIRAHIGVESAPTVVTMEEGAVKKFMRVTGDNNPLFTDEKAAKETGYEGKLVPPGFPCPDPLIAQSDNPPPLPNPWEYAIDGGSEWEFLKPVYVGDVLRKVTRITDVYEKQGRPGSGRERMIFVVNETVITNQRNEKVAVCRGTGVRW